jgi:hypothetical protein
MSREVSRKTRPPQPSIQDAAPAPEPAVAVLECKPPRILAKRFRCDGTRIDFQAGSEFKIHDVDVAGRTDLFELLAMLVDCPHLCLVRGACVAECPRADATDVDPWVYRRLRDRPGEPANFVSVPRRWVVYDFDDTLTPFTVTDPEGSVRAWHATLPVELRDAWGAFFPSAQAHVSATVRGKLVVWYDRPVSEALARGYALHYRADPSVCGAVQPNFFAAPIFEGCPDPLAGHRVPIVFEGGSAHPPPRVSLRATRSRPAPVRVGQLPTGSLGIVAALGPCAELAGLRFLLSGAVGGIMRKQGYTREACAAVLAEWLSTDPLCDVRKGVDWAVGAWERDRETVSGRRALAELIGNEHANLVISAILAARPLTLVWGGT